MHKFICTCVLLLVLAGTASAQRFFGRVFGGPAFSGSCANGQCGVQSMPSYGSACASGNCGVQYAPVEQVQYFEARQPVQYVEPQVVVRTRPIAWRVFGWRRVR